MLTTGQAIVLFHQSNRLMKMKIGHGALPRLTNRMFGRLPHRCGITGWI
jgi:hypothetical protein